MMIMTDANDKDMATMTTHASIEGMCVGEGGRMAGKFHVSVRKAREPRLRSGSL